MLDQWRTRAPARLRLRADLYGDNLTDLTLTSVKKLSSLAAKNAKMLQKQLLFVSWRRRLLHA